MKKWIVGSVGVVGLVCGMGLIVRMYFPGVWTTLAGWVNDVTGWTPEAQEADPVRFVEYVRHRLEKDLEVMEKTRRELSAEIGTISAKMRELEALRDQARGLAEDFRRRYQGGISREGLPIEVRGASYSPEQLRSQVALLLAEMQGYEASLAKLAEVRREAEAQYRGLTVQMEATEAELAALGAQREILRARRTTRVEANLVAQVEALLKENARVIQTNPVRSVRELLLAAEKPEQRRTEEAAVDVFLAGHEMALPAQEDEQQENAATSSGQEAPIPEQGVEKPKAPEEGGETNVRRTETKPRGRPARVASQSWEGDVIEGERLAEASPGDEKKENPGSFADPSPPTAQHESPAAAPRKPSKPVYQQF